jgi:hypothetical protein
MVSLPDEEPSGLFVPWSRDCIQGGRLLFYLTWHVAAAFEFPVRCADRGRSNAFIFDLAMLGIQHSVMPLQGLAHHALRVLILRRPPEMAKVRRYIYIYIYRYA